MLHDLALEDGRVRGHGTGRKKEEKSLHCDNTLTHSYNPALKLNNNLLNIPLPSMIAL